MAQHAFHSRCSAFFSVWNLFLLAFRIGTAISLLAVGGFLVFPLGLLGDLFDGSLHIAGPSNLVVSSGLKEIAIG